MKVLKALCAQSMRPDFIKTSCFNEHHLKRSFYRPNHFSRSTWQRTSFRAIMWNVSDFGQTKDGKDIKRYTAKNEGGIEVSVINYGATITSIRMKDKAGQIDDVVAGFDTLSDYEESTTYIGATVGRFANRIARGRFTLDGKEYQLATNNDPNHLHGGLVGFDKRVWTPALDGDRLRLTYLSPDGEEGYPGQLDVCVSFQLQADDSLVLDYVARAAQPTILNLTNHSYFNLAGHKCATIRDHTIQMTADKYTPKDDTNIPTGEVAEVAGSLFDLRRPVRLGDVLDNVPGGCGYDHNFCLPQGDSKKLVARVDHLTSGRSLRVYTTKPGVQFYTAHYLDCTGRQGTCYSRYSSFCLETQHYPDSINHPNFPSCVLRPGETYHHTTWYTFGVNQ